MQLSTDFDLKLKEILEECCSQTKISKTDKPELRPCANIESYSWDILLNTILVDDITGQLTLLTRSEKWDKHGSMDFLNEQAETLAISLQNIMFREEVLLLYSGPRFVHAAAHFLLRNSLYLFKYNYGFQITNCHSDVFVILKSDEKFWE